jgi:hypothetical protein
VGLALTPLSDALRRKTSWCRRNGKGTLFATIPRTLGGMDTDNSRIMTVKEAYLHEHTLNRVSRTQARPVARVQKSAAIGDSTLKQLTAGVSLKKACASSSDGNSLQIGIGVLRLRHLTGDSFRADRVKMDAATE